MLNKELITVAASEVVYKITIAQAYDDGDSYGYKRISGPIFGEFYPVPYWGNTDRYLIYFYAREGKSYDDPYNYYFHDLLRNGDWLPGGFTAYFEDGTSVSLPNTSDYNRFRDVYEAFKAHNGETARIVFTVPPTGHL